MSDTAKLQQPINPCTKIKESLPWTVPLVLESIPHGDMPGDKVKIEDGHIVKANALFPKLLEEIVPVLEANPNHKAVITVCGGSGVGKSEIASLLSYYFRAIGVGSYTLSGDNYPHRIPKYNDAERLRVFRESAIRAMVKEKLLSKERFDVIHEFQLAGDDANHAHIQEYAWYETYLRGGNEGLKGYLGTSNETDFDEVSSIVKAFKESAEKIWLKRMGREDTELWYEEVDFSDTNILIIEWTHGNSDYYQGVDVPILLNSTPQETLAHRRARNRDGAIDSPFTTLVLEIEQGMLESQAHKAKFIVSKAGELLTYEQYKKSMGECGGN